MERGGISRLAKQFVVKLCYFLRKCIFSVLSVGPKPCHIAFIMDGNRRYGKQRNLKDGAGHDAGYSALIFMLICCCELGIKYITAYAFSIDNFKRRPEEVQYIMDLTLEKIELELSRADNIYNRYGVRVHFSGNLELLSQPLQDAAKRLTVATANNSKALLTLCFAYTSTDEMVSAVQKTCHRKLAQIQEPNPVGMMSRYDQGEGNYRVVELADIKKHMYMAVAPDPDIIIRTSGEKRLSNFLLLQSTNSCLISFSQLWPGITFWHLVWVVLNFQRNYYYYLEKKKEQI
ncbi:hypothetical protein PTKIN_Ptkin10aG0097000 [Pterospermum kingtungense]